MAIPSVPQNFSSQPGNGNIFLSWSITATATSYTLQRSSDGVTFTTLVTLSPSNPGSGAPWNTYLDQSTVAGGPTVGDSYWYQVLATNGTGSSAYTAPVFAICENIGISSLGYLRLQAQERADMVNSQFVSTTEWNRLITQSCKALYDMLITAYESEYYLQNTFTWTLDGSDQLYPLPADFYKSFLVEVALNPGDPNSWVTLRRYQRIQQNLFNYPNVFSMYGVTNLRYRFTGNNIQFVPISQAGNTVRCWYAPRPRSLVADTDIFDGISGWEDYAIVRAAIKARIKEESDTTDLKAELADLQLRIDAVAESRDVQEPETVSDSKRRNFGWLGGDGDEGWGGNGSGY